MSGFTPYAIDTRSLPPLAHDYLLAPSRPRGPNGEYNVVLPAQKQQPPLHQQQPPPHQNHHLQPIAAAPDRAPVEQHTPKKKRPGSSSSSSVSVPGSRAFNESVAQLNALTIHHPIHDLPPELLRFIPDSQMELMRPLLYGGTTEGGDPFITKKKYATNVDERTFLSVYEFQLNDHWVIWDYHTGYVFFTGLWKAAGNTKTDIVKLVENIPSISSQVRRVRGGFLKIQGTWLPFETCRELAKNFAFPIRYCLVPLFGTEFPDECLKPGHEHYGKLVDIKDPPQPKTTAAQRRISSHSKEYAPRVMKPLLKKRTQSDSSQMMARRTGVPILEMEQVLKASKQLHELSTSSTGIKGADGVFRERQLSFNYGGFVWEWNDENNLTILGKDDEAVIDDDEDVLPGPTISSSVSGSSSRHGSAVWARQLENLSLSSPVETQHGHSTSPSFSTSHSTPPRAGTTQYTTTSEVPHTPQEAIPKAYAQDAIWKAAQQLVTFSSDAHQNPAGVFKVESALRDTPLRADDTEERSVEEKKGRVDITELLG